jgi:glycerol-1-phosphate dehydrogenase [NAD(P)+]
VYSINQILRRFKTPIKEILIEENLIEKAAILLDGIGFKNKKILLITDQNIYPNIGSKIADSLALKSNQILILQTPKADQKTVLEIANHAKNFDLIVAVGSGVINDLCKSASFDLKIPYVIFGTAPSMNGYASANASITVEGSYLGGASLPKKNHWQMMGVHNYKTSISAHLPSAIYLDLDVLKNSPMRLIRSGIGDSLCVSTCHFDWLLSHLLLGTYFDETAFDLLKPFYQDLTRGAFDFPSKEFVEILAKTLIISGIGMHINKGSYPASQAEHLIAHYIEILHPKTASKSYHGEQIAITTLTTNSIQERLLDKENLQIKPTNFDKNHLTNIFGEDLGNHFFCEVSKKAIDENLAKKINQNLQKNWQEMRQELRKTFIAKNDLLKSYDQFDLPKSSTQIDWSKEIYGDAINNAHLIRDRFTCLDLTKIIL